MTHGSLYDRPDLYDLMAPSDPFLERFYVETALERGGHVLELACGSGRLTIPLAKTGCRVTAGDLSPQMLQRAWASARAQALPIDFIELDMRTFDIGDTVDTIIVAINSILHLHSIDDLTSFFASAARHLSAEGRLVFDAFMPSVALLNSDPARRQAVGQARHESLGLVTVEETISYDSLAQVSQSDWYWSTVTEKDFWITPVRMRQIFPQEMPLLVAAGGLRLVERFGDFDRSPLASTSRRQICVCARP